MYRTHLWRIRQFSRLCGPHQCDPCTLQSLVCLPLLEVAALQWCFQRWLRLHSHDQSLQSTDLLQPLCRKEILLLSSISWLKQSISELPFNHDLDRWDVTALPAGHSCHLTSWYHQGVACSSPEAKVSSSAASHPSSLCWEGGASRMAYSTILVKATRLLFLCSCCPGSFWFGKSNGHQLQVLLDGLLCNIIMRSPVLSASDLKNKIVCLHCMFYSAILRKPEYTLSSLSPYHKGIQEKFLARICDLQCDSCLLCKLLKSWIGQRNGRMSLSPILTAAPVRTHSSHWRGQLPNLQVARKKNNSVQELCA